MPRNWWRSCFSLTFTWNRCRCFEWFLASPAEKEIPKHHHVYKCNRLLSKWPRFLRQHTKQLHLSVERQHVNQCKLGSVPLASASPDNPTQTCIWDHMSMFGEARRVTTAIGYCAERFWYVASSLQPALQSVEFWSFSISCILFINVWLQKKFSSSCFCHWWGDKQQVEQVPPYNMLLNTCTALALLIICDQSFRLLE